ncbi:MAG: DNA polymerase III subunit beta, partial [Alphaproteobacteria bacterium]|nr:DNA polymerase III subunit beta [Alphaproteobacteria bacterium]
MELRIDRTKLLNSLNHIQHVAERRNTVEILRNVLLECQNGVLCATATDIDTTLCETIECYVDEPGEKAVSAFMLYDIVRKLPDGAEILLKRDNDSVKVTVGRSFFRLAALPKTEFPAVDQFSVAGQCQIPASNMRGLIENTLFAAATTSEVRYYLNGIFLHYHAESQKLRAVATNSHRLARHEVSAPSGIEFLAKGIILPRKAVAELRRLLDGFDDSVNLEVGEANARFTVGSVVLTCKLIAGKYPDYERVIPALEGEPLLLETKAFFDGVGRVATISNASQNNGIKFILGAENLRLEAVDQDKNLGQEELQVNHSIVPFEVGFNASYLLDVGQRIVGENVQFWFPCSNGPVVLIDPES